MNFLKLFFIFFLSVLSLNVFSLPTKLYWFIPDGMRADPEEFNIYQWAQEGKLPNIKKLMEEGSYGYSIPDFPSHTPVNFASLLTGSHPTTHGISDGPMHVEGAPLVTPSAAGFSSISKRVAPIWTIMERDHNKKVVLLSVPGSTPPELNKGITIRGRWGGWGADNYSVIFESENKLPVRKEAGKGFRLFFLGNKLTEFVPTQPASGWSNVPPTFINPNEAKLESQGLALFAYLLEKNRILFSLDKKEIVADLKQGDWSSWIPVTLKFKGDSFSSNIKIKIIKLWKNGDFRFRVLFNNLNRLITKPGEVGEELSKKLGPMVDFADNWPHQLIYEDEDKETFLEEAKMSWEWHKNAVPFIFDHYQPNLFIQDIYTPNLMLESRWWYKEIDKSRKSYTEKKAKAAWKDIFSLYKGLDAIVGEAMKKKDDNTIIALSSDHGVCELKRLVKLNNLFAKKGWLKFTMNEKTGEPTIDWEHTKVIYMKMMNIFVNPKGLGGNWKRGSGPEYEKLVNDVIKSVKEIKDSNGTHPLVQAVKAKDAVKKYKLPLNRIGDIILEARVNYFWYEEVDKSLSVIVDSKTTGYKQSIDPKINKCMWTPFIVWGKGIKKGHKIKEPISHIQQVPTFLQLMGMKIPEYMEGKPLNEILE